MSKKQSTLLEAWESHKVARPEPDPFGEDEDEDQLLLRAMEQSLTQFKLEEVEERSPAYYYTV